MYISVIGPLNNFKEISPLLTLTTNKQEENLLKIFSKKYIFFKKQEKGK